MALILLISVTIAFAVGRYTKPAEVVTKEVEVVKKDVVTVVRTVKSPDGTVVRERRTEDRSETNTSREVEVKSHTPEWKAALMAGYSFKQGREVYGASIQKNFIGPISLGAWGLSDGTVGLSVGIEF